MDATLAARFGAPRYCQAGITESREDYFFYPVILGIDRAVDWVAARPDVDKSRFRYQGIGNGIGMTHSCRGHFYANFGKWVRSRP